MPTRFANIIRFPAGLQFKNATLGSRNAIKIGPARGWIYLPQANLREIDGFDRLLAPPRASDVEYALRVQNNGRKPYEHLRWGNYFTWNLHDPENTAIAWVTHGLIVFPAKQGRRLQTLERVARQCQAHLPAWYSVLADWIEVTTGIDLDPTHSARHMMEGPILNTIPWIFANRRGKYGYEYVNRHLVLMGDDGRHAMGPALWAAVIRAANRLKTPPEERLLLRDARSALARGSARRAILDAITALEIVVESALRKALLRRNPRKLVEHLLKSEWKLSMRVDLMRKARLWLPAGVDSALLELRNKVVHKNAAVTVLQAGAAVAAVTKFVDRYSTLRTP